MNQKRDFYLISVSISTFITVIAWIGFNIYHASVTSTVSQSLQKKIQPIEGKFDLDLINDLKKRQKIAPLSELPKSLATSSSGSKPSVGEGSAGTAKTVPATLGGQ